MGILEKIRSTPLRNLVYYGFLLSVSIGIIFFLLQAALPWEKGVAARELAGKTIKSEHHAITGLWYGALIVLVIIPVLLASGRIALRALSSAFSRDEAGLGKRSAPVFLVFAALAISIAASQMAPRLNNSLWGDEDYTTRRAIIGQWERNAEDELSFRKAKWTDTLFYYKSPNNHVLYSILARLAHSGYNAQGDPAKLHFEEMRLRLPAFIFGLGSIISLGYLLTVIGYRRAAIAAMFILAFHPWFLRHACEARGYSIVLCLAPLTLAFLIKALRRGRWRYWGTFAVLEFLLFYAYPGTIYILTTINLGALAYIHFTQKSLPRSDRLILTARWFSSSTLAALPTIFLMTPNLSQMQAYFARDRAQGELTSSWLWDNLGYIATGMPWKPWEVDNPNCLYLAENPVISLALLVGFYGFLIIGCLRLWNCGYRWILLVLVAPYLLMLLHSLIGTLLLYQWYAVIHLPFIICMVAIGIEYLPSMLHPVRLRTQAGLLLLGITLLPYTLYTGAQRKLQREQAVEPLLESVRLTRDVLNPQHPDVGNAITVQFCMITPGYDPTAYIIKKKYTPDPAKKLQALMKQADKSGKPLHINIGQPALARLEWPNLMAVIDNPELFQPLEPLYGLQNGCTRYIFRYLAESIIGQ